MRIRNGLGLLARRLGYVLKRMPVQTGTAILAGSMLFCGAAQADEVDFEDFEGLKLVPFTVAGGGPGDGTDWTNQIRTGTSRAWTIDNSGMSSNAAELAYDGWTAMDVDSWIDQQGVQLGRTSLGAGTNNTALVADPDAWEDSSGNEPFGYNSFISRAYNLTGFNVNTLEINFDYEFASYDAQTGTVEVSFNGGATWQLLLEIDSSILGDSLIQAGAPGDNVDIVVPASYSAAAGDFNPTSSNMLLRIGCFEADNDWWFAIDNISVTTANGFSDFEDFEGLKLLPFTNQPMVGDGTDYTQDIPNWEIDNSGNLFMSEELAFNGFAVLDVNSWVSQQGAQIGRTLFAIEDPNNSTLVIDGDAMTDFAVPGVVDNGINAYISRTYNLSGFDSTTVTISFEYEFAAYADQTGLAEVSFDGGATYQTLLELDSTVIGDSVVVANLGVFTAGVDFDAVASNFMKLRFGYIEADNDWWFAIDNILIEADPADCIAGDVNQDGVITLLDVAPFVDVLSSGQFQCEADTNLDGVISLLDVAPFVQLLVGP